MPAQRACSSSRLAIRSVRQVYGFDRLDRQGEPMTQELKFISALCANKPAGSLLARPLENHQHFFRSVGRRSQLSGSVTLNRVAD